MRKWVLIIGIAMALAAFVAVRWRGAMKPARQELGIDASIPWVQPGFTLYSVSRIDKTGLATCSLPDKRPYLLKLWDQLRGVHFTPLSNLNQTYVNEAAGGIALWMQASQMPALTAGGSYPTGSFTAFGRASNGQTFPLTATVVGGRPGLLVTIPPGYPADFRYMDVTIRDSKGHQGMWRVVGLPPMRHAIPPPVNVLAAQTIAGITLKVRAWRELPNQTWGGIYNLRWGLASTGTLTQKLHWEVTTIGAEREWEPDGGVVDNAGGMTIQLPIGGSTQSSAVDAFRTQGYLRPKMEVRQYDALDERFTFHNLTVNSGGTSHWLTVSRAQTVTSPSGLTVTLPIQSAVASQMGMQNSLVLTLTYPSTLPAGALPRSPLWRKYHQPIQVEIHGAEAPFRLSSWGASGGQHDINLQREDASNRPLPIPRKLQSLTVIIRQRVARQTIPIAFTVPIEPKAPSQRDW